MGRRKGWWTGWLFSYGPRYVRGKVAGFNITVRADDGTDSMRVVSVKLGDRSAAALRDALIRHLERDRSNDLPEQEEGEGDG